MAQQRLEALGVVLGGVNAAAMRHAQHHRAGQSPARAVAQARHVTGDLIERRIDESHELNFGHGLQALRRHADRGAGDQAFGQRRILHARLAEALLQPDRGAKHAAVGADIFPQHDDRRVVRHLPGVRHVDGLDHRHLRHRNRPCSCLIGVQRLWQRRVAARFLALGAQAGGQLRIQVIEHAVRGLFGRRQVLLDGGFDLLAALAAERLFRRPRPTDPRDC